MPPHSGCCGFGCLVRVHLHDRFPQGILDHLSQGVIEDDDFFDVAWQFLAKELLDLGIVLASYRLLVGKGFLLYRPVVNGEAAGVNLKL